MTSINEIKNAIEINRESVENFVAEHSNKPALMRQMAKEMPKIVLASLYLEAVVLHLSKEELDMLDKDTVDFLVEIGEYTGLPEETLEYLAKRVF